MNESAQAELDGILAKDPQTVSEYEMSILRARISYLSEEQKERFGLVEKVVSPYVGLKNADLRKLCADRAIVVPVEAKKNADIVALLEAADAVAGE